MTGTYEIVKEFGFEAAHTFAHKAAGHENTRIHGHSFKVEVALRGQPDSVSGCVVDFENVSTAINVVRTKLDHHFLNDLPGLGSPSLENLARWIAGELRTALPQVASVTVRRPTLGESCRFDVA
ncbi:MAG: 6-carboxytetrahydropterin synthase [Rhodospirillaceae bacterium]|nr:MAG: 6-carboxytetrahydropterin synthase [Rhodospirillaceae bacterium]